MPGSDRAVNRQRKIRDWEQRIELLHAKFPRLAEIDQLYKQMAIEWARLGLGRKHLGMSFEELQKSMDSLQAERKQLLGSLHIGEEIYDIWWDCAICQDTGFLSPGIKCSCLLREEAEAKKEISGLSPEQKRQTFENFSLHYYTDKARYTNILASCRSFADKLIRGEPTKNLVLTGPVGIGKTHLSSAIANEVLSAGKNVVYLKIGTLLDIIRENKFQDKGEFSKIRSFITKADLLLIDDLGTEVLTDFAGEQILNVLDERINYHLPWVISTNFTPNELDAHYELRMVDRITGSSTFLVFVGESNRRKKAVRS